jgi:hypothetical protein
MGSPQFRRFDAGACCIVDVWFPPHAALQLHTHERSNFATMVDGSFQTRITSHRIDCATGVTWTEPAEERHANYVGSGGARVLVVQPDQSRDDIFSPFRGLTGAIVRVKHPAIVSGARHILAELRAPDSLTPLVIDSLVLPMMATAVRVGALRRPERARPAWLSRAQEIIHARFRERLLLDEIAAAVDVTPGIWRARSRDFGMTIGSARSLLRLSGHSTDWRPRCHPAQSRSRRATRTSTSPRLRRDRSPAHRRASRNA